MGQTVSDQDFAEYLESIRRFTDEKLIPAERRVEDEEAVPEEIVDEMRRLGLFGMTIPEDYGGLGLSIEQQCLATMEFTRASCVYRARFSTTLGLSSQAILYNGTDDQKREWLLRMASGEATASFALTEPEAGSDAGALKTKAVPDGNGYVISGQKCFITNAIDADVFIVMARTDPETDDAKGISAFIVPASTPGIEVAPPDRKLGNHGSPTSQIFFDDCRVDGSTLLGGEVGQGFKNAMAGINSARMHVASTCVSQATRLIEMSLAYAMERKQFGQAIAEFQAIQHMLADSHAETLAARSMTLETARKLDAGERPLADMSSSKYFASEMVCRVADRAVQIHGGAGYMAAFDVERFYRDVRLFRIFEGTSEIHKMIIAREMIKQAEA
ncbi:MAG: acyl-CoA dehydrogenase family protein [Alphaproteobacteria bacterium]|jgi:acyl-CoA dehydrogenase|nr:acyl-CoA dehydrogenase family protein [Alphaproteobacteria bacterium]